MNIKGLIDLIAGIGLTGTHKQARDTLGRVYSAGEPGPTLRSRIGAASCLWSDDVEQGRQDLEKLQTQCATQKTAIADVMAEITRDYSAGRGDEKGRGSIDIAVSI